MYRIALLSLHGCPLARLGEKDSGGMNVYVLQVARELGRRGTKVDVFTRSHDLEDPQAVNLGDNARVIHLKAGPYNRTKESLHRHIPEFLDNLRQFQQSDGTYYDLIHSHYWLSGCAGATLSREWDIPHVTTFHTLAKKKIQARPGEKVSKLRLSTELGVMNSADAIVVSTDQERDDLSSLYQLSPCKVQVIPAGVDLKMFRPLNKALARRKLGLTEKRVVLTVGRLEPLKGIDIVISAMAKLEDVRNTRLLVVGGESAPAQERARLRALVAEIGLEDVVTFAGAVDQAELPTYFSATDVFVLSSYYESFGLVALEAMACGIPVVTSRVGGPDAFIEDGVTGYLIPWHCPESYAQRLDMLLANPALRSSIGRAAMTKAQTMGWNMVASRLLCAYSSSIGATWERVSGA